MSTAPGGGDGAPAPGAPSPKTSGEMATSPSAGGASSEHSDDKSASVRFTKGAPEILGPSTGAPVETSGGGGGGGALFEDHGDEGSHGEEGGGGGGEGNQPRIDLTTGAAVDRRQSIRVLDVEEVPQPRWQRIVGKMGGEQSFFGLSTAAGLGLDLPPDGVEGGDDEEDVPPPPPRTYRIKSSATSFKQKICCAVTCPCNLTQFINECLRWTFRASFMEVTLVSYLAFLGFVCAFALLVYWIGRYRPQCVTVAGSDFIEAGTMFMDAFHISWTTLSTVGYGVIFPRVPLEKGQIRCIGINFLMAFESFVGVLFGGVTGAVLVGKVARIQSTAMIEFSHPICVRYGTGVMQGVKEDEEKTEKRGHRRVSSVTSVDSDELDAEVNLPCPILEFRMVNELSATDGGEILNASVNVVATTVNDDEDAASARDWQTKSSGSSGTAAALATKAAQVVASSAAKATTSAVKTSASLAKTGAKATTKAAISTAKATSKAAVSTAKATGTLATNTGAALFGAGKKVTRGTGSLLQRLNYSVSHRASTDASGNVVMTDESGQPIMTEEELAKQLEKELEQEVANRLIEKVTKEQERLAGVALKQEAITSVAVLEDNSQLAPQRIFHKLEVETESHPFFKRQWTIRHQLDENSPLLSATARKMVADNHGFWPHQLNDHYEIREHLRFRELIVNFSGTANVSGSSVYAQHVYDYADVNIGYAFANVLALNKRGILIADKALINDVREQKGGGGEPFTDVIDTNITTTATEFVAQVAETTNTQAKHIAENTTAVAKDAHIHMQHFADKATGSVQGAVSTARQQVLGKKDLSVVREVGASEDQNSASEDDTAGNDGTEVGPEDTIAA